MASKKTNHAPVVSGFLTASATEDGALSTVNAVSNASDIDVGDTLSVVFGALPAGVTYNSLTRSFTLNPSNAAYQHLAQGQTTTVTLNYSVSDGTASTADKITWTITGVNDAPVVSGVLKGVASEGSSSTLNALANASDVDDGTVLTVTDMGALPAGVSYNGTTKTFTLDATNAAYDSLAVGQHQTVTVAYKVFDG